MDMDMNITEVKNNDFIYGKQKKVIGYKKHTIIYGKVFMGFIMVKILVIVVDKTL